MASNTNSATGFHRSLGGGYLSIYYDGTEVQRFNGSGGLATGTAAGRIFAAGSTTTPASTPIATAASGDSMFRVVTGLDHDSTYGAYFRSYIRTAAISADAFRAFGTVLNVAADTVRGAHISLSFGDTGTVSGLGVALECTLHIANQATQAGTMAPLKLAIHSDGATSDPAGSALSYIRVDNQGDATGGADVDDDAFLFDIQGHTIATGNMVAASTTEANYSHSIKARVGATTVYIMCASAEG